MRALHFTMIDADRCSVTLKCDIIFTVIELQICSDSLSKCITKFVSMSVIKMYLKHVSYRQHLHLKRP